MKTVIRFDRKCKRKPMGSQMQAETMEVDSLVEMIQALIPLGLLHVQEALQKEVTRLAGEKYSRTGGVPGYDRWGSQQGSVYLADQKVGIRVLRVRDVRQGQEVPLVTYEKLQQPRQADQGLMLRVLRGLSCRSYETCAETVPGVFGLSPSSVSRRFIKVSAQKLAQLCERDLSGYDLVAIFLDGKTFAEDEMIIALGITIKGEKVLLGFVQAGTENERVCREFLRGLVDRGLRYQQGLLCVIDGSKGLKAAIGQVFGYHARIQRCQWHKRENVVSYLPSSQQARFRTKLRRAYAMSTYQEAQSALLKIRQELEVMNRSAVSSLDEGFEETLTLHHLGLFKVLGESFKTTNCLESINAQIGQRTDKVDRWRNSDQKQRWVATALLDIEPTLRRVKGYRYLPLLRSALQATIQEVEKKNVQEVA